MIRLVVWFALVLSTAAYAAPVTMTHQFMDGVVTLTFAYMRTSATSLNDIWWFIL